MGFSSWGIVRVRFLTLPTWTVTYGSEVPLLSFAIRPWAQITGRRKDSKSQGLDNKSRKSFGQRWHDCSIRWTNEGIEEERDWSIGRVIVQVPKLPETRLHARTGTLICNEKARRSRLRMIVFGGESGVDWVRKRVDGWIRTLRNRSKITMELIFQHSFTVFFSAEGRLTGKNELSARLWIDRGGWRTALCRSAQDGWVCSKSSN